MEGRETRRLGLCEGEGSKDGVSRTVRRGDSRMQKEARHSKQDQPAGHSSHPDQMKI
jgi:hypothetical protein